MNDTLITVASYDDLALANHHAELLRNRGLACEVTDSQVADLLANLSEAPDEFVLRVPEAQAVAAFEWLEALEQTPLYEPSAEGDTLLLIGAVLAMVGILVSFGRFEGISTDFLLFPYALALFGGCLFLRGLMLNRAQEATAGAAYEAEDLPKRG